MLQLGVGAWVGWMRDHTVSIQKMIEKYSASVVVAGANLQYLESCLFHDGDTVQMESHSVVHKKGILIEGVTEFTYGGKKLAKMSVFLRPVIIGDEHSSAAKSGSLLPELQDLFSPEEFSQVPYARYVKQLLPSIEREGELIATGIFPFKLHRYAMDFADQWAFMETAAYVGASRENLSVTQANKHPRLIEGISAAVKNYYLDLKRPYFLFDEAYVESKAYIWQEKLFFVHSLQSNLRGESQLHALVIEEMQ
ncbi:MAG: hypothetical protein Q7T48_10490 [Cellvibrio sp.]|uniref:hypothetical protein n=1 Tax=Cellvibrio sp. TaxID=1965322 RepID=UPI00271F7495|nr:hypothetical protein [Cellvibrio sp.]